MFLFLLRAAMLFFLVFCIAIPLINSGYDYIRNFYGWMYP